MYGLLYECKFLTIEETNKKKIKKLVNQNPLKEVDSRVFTRMLWKDGW
jgi:hypothetical protein